MHTALWLSCMELDAGRPEGAKFRLAIRKIQKTPLQKAVQPESAVEHPRTDKHDGQIWVSASDMQGAVNA